MKETWISRTDVQLWYLEGKPHREDGPAVIFPRGSKLYCLHGIHYQMMGDWERAVEKIGEERKRERQ